MRQDHTVNVIGGRDVPGLSAVWLLGGPAGLGTEVCVLCAPAGLMEEQEEQQVGWVCMGPSLARLHFCTTMGAEQEQRV